MAGDALGLAQHGHHVAVEERDHIAVHLVGGGAVELEVARRRRDVGARLLHRLAGVARLELGELVEVIEHALAEFHQQAPAFDCGQLAQAPSSKA